MQGLWLVPSLRKVYDVTLDSLLCLLLVLKKEVYLLPTTVFKKKVYMMHATFKNKVYQLSTTATNKEVYLLSTTTSKKKVYMLPRTASLIGPPLDLKGVIRFDATLHSLLCLLLFLNKEVYLLPTTTFKKKVYYVVYHCC